VRETTDRPTTVVVTADHGENLGYPADDGGMIAHSASASEGLLHVPLDLIDPPEGYPARVDEFVSHLSLRSLVAGLGAGETPSVVDSAPVLAERVGSPATADDRLSADQLARLRRSIRCAYDDGEKFEWDSLGTARRHRLDPDRPNWQEPVETDVDVSAYESLFDVPIREYHRRAERETSERDVDEATLRRLSDLGYA
jgi:arylsulfatase A-like enzyme